VLRHPPAIGARPCERERNSARHDECSERHGSELRH